MAKSDKHRYFNFIVYPESAPPDWLESLKETHCCFAVSPVHSADEKEAKPHHHVIYYSPGPVTLDNVRKVVPETVPANGHIEPAKSPQGSQRYLIHLDDPEKEQFPQGPKSITVLNGFPLDLTRQYSAAELRELRRRIIGYIQAFNITEYSELIDQLMDYDVDMCDYASTHTIFFNSYITSKRNRAAPE